jgi:hypothetical protein
MDRKIIASCGLSCSDCGAYLAWKNDDEALRVKTAAEWKQAFGFDFVPGMINCSGCREEGPKIGHCAECEIRACTIGKGVHTCAECAEYPCKTISDFIANVPEAKNNLESLRA